jgi:hypothetical protein
MHTSIPLRFPISQSCLAKWDQLANEDKQALLARFVRDSELLYRHRHQPKLKQSVDVMVPNKFALASEQAAQHSMRLDQYASAFGLYVTLELRKGRPVRGEVELAAQWAELTGVQYRLEQPCAAGRIDILLYPLGRKPVIVEAKLAGDWKHALGQVLAYKYCLGADTHDTALLLLSHDKIGLAEQCANSLSVKVYWYDGNLNKVVL